MRLFSTYFSNSASSAMASAFGSSIPTMKITTRIKKKEKKYYTHLLSLTSLESLKNSVTIGDKKMFLDMMMGKD